MKFLEGLLSNKISSYAEYYCAIFQVSKCSIGVKWMNMGPLLFAGKLGFGLGYHIILGDSFVEVPPLI